MFKDKNFANHATVNNKFFYKKIDNIFKTYKNITNNNNNNNEFV